MHDEWLGRAALLSCFSVLPYAATTHAPESVRILYTHGAVLGGVLREYPRTYTDREAARRTHGTRRAHGWVAALLSCLFSPLVALLLRRHIAPAHFYGSANAGSDAEETAVPCWGTAWLLQSPATGLTQRVRGGICGYDPTPENWTI